MTVTVEMTGAGLIWRDHEGAQVGALLLADGDGEGVLIRTGTIPEETALSRDHLQHVEDLVHRTRFLAVVGPAGRPSPPRAPHFPS